MLKRVFDVTDLSLSTKKVVIASGKLDLKIKY